MYVYLYVILRPAGQCFCSNRYVIIHVEGLQHSGLCLTPTSSDKEGTSLCKPVVSWGLGFCGLIRRTGHFSPLATSKDYWGLLKIFLSRTIEALHLAPSPILPVDIQGMKGRRQLTLAFWNRQLHWRGSSYKSTKTKVPFYSRCNMIKTTPCSVGTVGAEHWSEILQPFTAKGEWCLRMSEILSSRMETIHNIIMIRWMKGNYSHEESHAKYGCNNNKINYFDDIQIYFLQSNWGNIIQTWYKTSLGEKVWSIEWKILLQV